MNSISSVVVVAVTLFGAVNAGLQANELMGCYTSTTSMVLQVASSIFDPKYNSVGGCGKVCRAGSFAAFAMEDMDCYCGQKLPPSITLTDAADCNIACPGYPTDICGGAGFYSVYVTGFTSSITNATAAASDVPAHPSSTTSAPSTAKTTLPPTTSVVTAKPGASNTNGSTPGTATKKSGASLVGIAVGIVVALIAVAAIAGGLWLFLRNKNKQEIEEEHRRQAAVNQFIHGGKTPGSSAGASFNDTRLDPVVMSQRRMSDGSIADNQDYSRRILKVTNA